MLGSADRAMTDWKRVQKLNFRSSDRRMLCIIPFMHGIWNQVLGFRNIRVFIPWKRTQGMTPRILIIMIHLLAVWCFQEPNDETAKSASIGSWKLPDVPFSDIGIIVYFQKTDGNLPPWCKWRLKKNRGVNETGCSWISTGEHNKYSSAANGLWLVQP